VRYVTSFGPDGYFQYGKEFLESFVKYNNTPITVYVEKDIDFVHPNVETKDLFKVPGCEDFLTNCTFPAFHGRLWGEKRNYRFDAFRFCRKSFAQCDAAADNDGWLIWIDADVVLRGMLPLPSGDSFIHYMGRPDWHSCASYVAWNLDHPVSGEFWKRYWSLYVTGTVFALPEWHDSYVLDFLIISMKLPSVNIAAPYWDQLKGPANVFDYVFPMGHHKKGNLKKA